MSWIVLATEDELSEQVGLALIQEVGLAAGQRLRRQGNGYLRSRIPNFCSIAAVQPILVISDLDQQVCPSAMILNWLGQRIRPDNLLLRIAVREIESWLLADHDGMRVLLGRRVSGRLPDEPDALFDPKRELLKLAEHAPRATRDELLPQKGAFSPQGLGYNTLLSQFVKAQWSSDRAEKRSPSLKRTRQRIRELADRVAR